MQKITLDNFRETLDRTRDTIARLAAVSERNNEEMGKDVADLSQKLEEIDNSCNKIKKASFTDSIWYAFGFKSTVLDSIDAMEKDSALAKTLINNLTSLVKEVERTLESYGGLQEDMRLLNNNLGTIIEHNQRLESKVNGLEKEIGAMREENKQMREENKILHRKMDEQAKKMDKLMDIIIRDREQPQKKNAMGII